MIGTLNRDIKQVGAAIDVQHVHAVLLNDGRRVRNAKMPLTRTIKAMYTENQYLKQKTDTILPLYDQLIIALYLITLKFYLKLIWLFCYLLIQ